MPQKNMPKLLERNRQSFRDRWRQKADALRIEAVQQQHQAAQSDGGDLKPAQRPLVDDLTDGESARARAMHGCLPASTKCRAFQGLLPEARKRVHVRTAFCGIPVRAYTRPPKFAGP